MRNFKKLFVITTAFVVMFCNIFQSFAAARFNKPEMASMEAVKTAGSWSQDADGRWSFTPAGEEPVKDGWFYANSGNSSSEYKWYCFDENGIMRTGWIADKNDPSIWYYAGETKDASEGSIITGWITDPQDGKKYYLDPATGIMVSGWRQIGRKWYYFGERQYADRSWAPDNTGHITVGAKGTHSYGAMYTNEYTPDGYYVGPDGAWNSNLPGSSGSGRHDPVVITYTVTFNINGHGTAPGAQIVKAGSTVSEPTPQPSAEGFIFGGWFKEPACENRWDFASGKVTSDVTLYAKWTEIDQVTIIYQSEAENKGTVSPTSESINPETGTATGSKASPSDGYGFINWTNAAGNIVGTNETFIPEKKDGKYAEETYTALFEARTYKVMFKGNIAGYTDQTIDEIYDTHYILPAESPIKTGYAFSGWYTAVEDGTEITSDTVVKITEDTDLYAQYTPLSYQTVFYGNYEGSKYAETISECYDSNFVLPETNPERTGYTFSGWWTKSEGGNQITTQTRVDASVRGAYAHWIADTHRVTAQVAGSHGSASAKIGETEVAEAKTDEEVTFIAVSETGYEFDHWEVVSGGIDIDSVKTDNPLTVAMPATALTLKAHFRAVVPGEYNIILEDDGHGTATAKVNGSAVTTAAPGSSVTLIATPGEAYVFKEWSVARGLNDGAITDNTFTMPSNEVKIKAIFEREYTVEVTAQGHGSASADVIKGISGTEVTLTVTPEDGYKLDSLSVERGGISITDNKFTIGSADVKIKAVFVADTPDTYSIILEGDGHGLAIAKVDDSEVTSAAPGASVTLIATPNEGYAFKEWNIVRGLSDGAITDSTFTMPSNEVKIKAIFDRAYNINVQVQGHGSASATVDGQTATCARKNASVTLTATPEDGYELKGWTVVSGDITISNNAFTMSDCDVTVKAVFIESTPVTKYKITLENDGNGLAMAKVGDTVVTSAAAGETVKLTVTPSDGYDFESWEPTPNTLVIGTDNTFIMPECDVTVKANFEEASYYAVCIWDIEGESGSPQKIIFGPAIGPDYDTAIRNVKEIKDDWDTISANAATGMAREIYSTALAEGHIKKIKITLNNDIFSGTKPTGTFSTFHTSIKSDYRKWNGTYSSSDCESTNYATSRIRATLNGRDGWDPSSYAGENLLDDSNCLLSCFPEDLQRNIVVRESNIPTNWTINSPYTINSYETIRDKLWLANANEIYGSSCGAAYIDYGVQFAKNSGKSSTDYKVYDETGTAHNCWLRSPYRGYRMTSACIYNNGNCSNSNVTISSYGISPFFMIGGSAPKTYSYNLASDENGSWIQDGAAMESFETTNASVPSVDEDGSITYTGTDGIQHEVKAIPKVGYTYDSCSYNEATRTFYAVFKEKESLSMFNLQPEDEELSEEALDPEVIIEDIPTEEEITTDGKSDEDNPDEKPIENLPSAGIINSDPANSSEIKEKPQNDSSEE